MHDLTVIKRNGCAYIDSREAAEIIGKRHGDLLRDIQRYAKYMEKSIERKIALNDFFLESSYVDAIGRTLPCYLISKMGCELVANKLTGEKGVLFTAIYVSKFNMMESAERAELEAVAAMPAPRLGEYNACARIIVRALNGMGAASERVIGFLNDLYGPLGISVAEDDGTASAPRMYTAKQIAKMLGIYSLGGNPHYQAAACILNENIFISDAHKSVVTEAYGNHVGVCVRYDDFALQSVRGWLREYGYPREVYGFERTYRVLYDFQPDKPCDENRG